METQLAPSSDQAVRTPPPATGQRHSWHDQPKTETTSSLFSAPPEPVHLEPVPAPAADKEEGFHEFTAGHIAAVETMDAATKPAPKPLITPEKPLKSPASIDNQPRPTAPVVISPPDVPSNSSGRQSDGGQKRHLPILASLLLLVSLGLGAAALAISLQNKNRPTMVVSSGNKSATVTLPKNVEFTNVKAQQATISDGLTVGQQADVGSLTVNGIASVSGAIKANSLILGGKQICTSKGCISSTPGSSTTTVVGGNFLKNGTATQGGNFHLQSVSSGSVAGIIAGHSGQTADLLQLQNSAGSVLARFDAAGNLTVHSATINATLAVKGSASVSGDLSVSGHYLSGGSKPHTTNGGAAGGGSATISGNDTFGTISITTGGSPGSSGTLVIVTFAKAFAATPHVVISPANASAAGALFYTGTISKTSFQINVAAIPSGSTTYSFNYFVGQ